MARQYYTVGMMVKIGGLTVIEFFFQLIIAKQLYGDVPGKQSFAIKRLTLRFEQRGTVQYYDFFWKLFYVIFILFYFLFKLFSSLKKVSMYSGTREMSLQIILFFAQIKK